MKKILFFVLVLVGGLFASPESDTILQEIKNMREDMNKRFEQVDKRFEQVDKRLEFLQTLVYLALSVVVASPFVLEYLRSRRETEERKTLDNVKSMLFVLREMAQEDENIAKKLRAAGLV